MDNPTMENIGRAIGWTHRGLEKEIEIKYKLNLKQYEY